MRQRVTWLLVAAEVLALTVSFGIIFLRYLQFLLAMLSAGKGATEAAKYVALVATALALGAAVFEGIKYLRGVRWARLAFLIENVALLALGVMWFVWNRFRGDKVNTDPAWFGLVLPMLTLLPLLWPLLFHSPGSGGDSGGRDSTRGGGQAGES
jgi:hypothetical protein